MTDPTTAIPVHFTLEFLVIGGAAAVAGWAASRRRPIEGIAAAALLVAQVLHVGSYVSGEAAVLIVALRWVALAAAGVAWLRRTQMRAWWGAAWAVVAAAQVWAAAAATPSTVLGTASDVAVHGVRAGGGLLLGVWAWRVSRSVLRLRVADAFGLVLLVVVLVSGGAVLRTGAIERRDEEVDRLAVRVGAERDAIVRTRDEVLRRAVESSPAFSRLSDDQVVRTTADLRERVYPDLDLIVVVAPDGSTRGTGTAAAASAGVPTSPGVTSASGGSPSAAMVTGTGALYAIGASPIAARPDVLALGRRFDAGYLGGIVDPGESAVIVANDRVVASSDPDLDNASVPPGDARTREIAGGRWIVARAPLGDGATLALLRLEAVVTDAVLDVSRALVGALLGASLLAIVIALWLGSRLTRPVLALTRTAQLVESGDLEAAPDTSSPDEIGDLARAFGSMTASLRTTIDTEQEVRRRLETIVEGMGEGLVAMDGDFNIVSFNPAAERIIGVRASRALGRKCYDVYGERTRGREGQPMCDYICPLRHGGGTDGGVALERRDGRTTAIAVSCSTLTDEEGNVIGGVDLLRDVTPELRAEQMKSSFLANISHELRTPLTPILGYADLLQRRKVPRKEADKYLAEISSAAKRLERVVTILVDMAALEAGRLEPHPRPTEVRELVTEAAAPFRGRSRRHPVRTQIGRALPAVQADPGLIRRVLEELIDNAIKFSPDGGTVTVRARAADDAVEFSVTDRGIGIEAEHLAELGEDFVQADPSSTRRFGGLGVGLSFVGRVLQGHGSQLDVRSRPGRGSTATFSLRAERPARRGRRR